MERGDNLCFTHQAIRRKTRIIQNVCGICIYKHISLHISLNTFNEVFFYILLGEKNNIINPGDDNCQGFEAHCF